MTLPFLEFVRLDNLIISYLYDMLKRISIGYLLYTKFLTIKQ